MQSSSSISYDEDAHLGLNMIWEHWNTDDVQSSSSISYDEDAHLGLNMMWEQWNTDDVQSSSNISYDEDAHLGLNMMWEQWNTDDVQSSYNISYDEDAQYTGSPSKYQLRIIPTQVLNDSSLVKITKQIVDSGKSIDKFHFRAISNWILITHENLCVWVQLCLALTAHNWQKWKRVFLTCPCHEIIGMKQLVYLKNYDLCEYVKFGAISWKFDILSITV